MGIFPFQYEQKLKIVIGARAANELAASAKMELSCVVAWLAWSSQSLLLLSSSICSTNSNSHSRDAPKVIGWFGGSILFLFFAMFRRLFWHPRARLGRGGNGSKESKSSSF